MPRTIQILPDAVANQIAAGEVVERPASVVKELVENALDAGATRVDVEIDGGGSRRIRVADDGGGMGREDALLSLDRHATSKILRPEDLRGIRSYGFRGEALPSIASVSRMTLESAVTNETVGTRVSVRGGVVMEVSDHPRTTGTTVVVERLFFNAPARARFLRPPGIEARAVQESMVSLALAYPEVGFTLSSDGRTVLDLPPVEDLVPRIAAIWGNDEAEGLLPIAVDVGREGETNQGTGIRVRGLIQRPDRARPGFRRAHLFVDRRPFRDPALLRAADRGYRTTIPEGARPWLFLYIDVPEGSVDVNVHPSKAEVRFRARGEVERAIESAVRRSLEGPESAARLDRGGALPSLPLSPPTPPSAGRGQMRLGAAEAPQMSFLIPVVRDATAEPEGAAGGWGSRLGTEAGGAETRDSQGGPETPFELEGFQAPRLWQVHRAWILAEVRDGILLIDQHAAHERILFERIMARFEEGESEAQRLLFPLTVRLTPAEARMVLDVRGMLLRAGFEVEPFGTDTVILHAVPNPHPYFDAEACFREMVEELTHGSELLRSARNQNERVAMSFACKAAIKAGQPLSPQEIQELFDQLFATQLPFHDVHGRPTTVRLSRGELERKFGR
jgi:DNA mismatch repair protein MutL